MGLLQEDGHYDALCSLPGFFGKSYFCSRCFQAYNDQGQHACPNNEANHCGACLQEERQYGRRYHCIGTPLGMARSCQSFPGLHGMANLANSTPKSRRRTGKRSDTTTTHPCILGSTSEYPVGHATFLYEPDTTDLSPYFGLGRAALP